MTTRTRHERGVTLLEAIISLALLLIGILGTMQLQIIGVTADSGARANTQALQLARELAAGLEKLDPFDAMIDHHHGGVTPPPEFGHLLQPDGTVVATGFTPWDDGRPVGGVRTDAAILAVDGVDAVDPTLPRFQRRWTVWQAETAATSGGVKLVAVSVTYREKGLSGLREVVLLTQVSNRGLSSAFASAYR
jgi:hypothetical protein